MAFVTVTLPSSAYSLGSNSSRYTLPVGSRLDLGTSLSSDPSENRYLAFLSCSTSSFSLGQLVIALVSSQTEDLNSPIPSAFSDEMLMDGEITFVASDGTSVVVTGISDTTETYNWLPSNGADVGAFFNNIRGLTNRDLTITFDDRQNYAPEVTASSSASIVAANGTIQLTSTATDIDPVPDTLALQWTANPNIGAFSDDDALTTDWTAPGPTDNDRVVILTQTATEPDENLEGSAIVTVTVRGNQAPIVTASADQTTVDVGETVNLSAR